MTQILLPELGEGITSVEISDVNVKVGDNISIDECKFPYIDKKTGKAIPFFYLGDQSKSEKLLDINNKNKIENAFKAEMKELGYL